MGRYIRYIRRFLALLFLLLPTVYLIHLHRIQVFHEDCDAFLSNLSTLKQASQQMTSSLSLVTDADTWQQTTRDVVKQYRGLLDVHTYCARTHLYKYPQYQTDWVEFFNTSNPFEYRYLLNKPELCEARSVTVLVYVHSDPDNVERRKHIRQSWGSVKQYRGLVIQVIFTMGVRDADVQKRLTEEQKGHGDIIQASFPDSYLNIRHKHQLGLKWISEHCAGSTYVIKADDDVFMNIHKVLDYLLDVMKNAEHLTHIPCAKTVHRDRVGRKGKCAVPEREYPYDVWPPYCVGLGFVMSTTFARQLYVLSLELRPVRCDDVWVTGILAGHLSVTHSDLSLHIFKAGYNLEKMNIEAYDFLIAEHDTDFHNAEGTAYFLTAWNLLQQQQQQS